MNSNQRLLPNVPGPVQDENAESLIQNAEENMVFKLKN